MTDPTAVQELADQLFEAAIADEAKPTVAHFWAKWCGPCRAQAPTIKELAQEFNGRALFVRVNCDNHQQLCAKYNIHAIPTVLIFRGGKVLKKFVGLTARNQLHAEIEAAIALQPAPEAGA